MNILINKIKGNKEYYDDGIRTFSVSDLQVIVDGKEYLYLENVKNIDKVSEALIKLINHLDYDCNKIEICQTGDSLTDSPSNNVIMHRK